MLHPSYDSVPIRRFTGLELLLEGSLEEYWTPQLYDLFCAENFNISMPSIVQTNLLSPLYHMLQRSFGWYKIMEMGKVSNWANFFDTPCIVNKNFTYNG